MHISKLLLTSAAALGLMASAAQASSFTYTSWDNGWGHHRTRGHHYAEPYRYHPHNSFVFRIGTPIHRARGPMYYPVYYPQPIAVGQPVMQQIAFTNPGDNGNYCREYQATTRIGGRLQQSYGTACMQPDGSWQIIN